MARGRPSEGEGHDDDCQIGGDDRRCQVPLEFDEFQVVFKEWIQGTHTDDAVLARYGAATLEMLQAQRICQMEEDEEVLGEREDGARDEELATSQVPTDDVQADSGLVADTMLDVVLEGALVPMRDVDEDEGEGCAGNGQGGAEPVLGPGEPPSPLAGPASSSLSDAVSLGWLGELMQLPNGDSVEGREQEGSSRADERGLSKSG